MYFVSFVLRKKLNQENVFFDTFFFFLKTAPEAHESSGAGIESELQLLCYIIGAATLDPSCICDLAECWMLNPLSKTRVWTWSLMDTRQALNLLSHNGNSFSDAFNSHSICLSKYLMSGQEHSLFLADISQHGYTPSTFPFKYIWIYNQAKLIGVHENYIMFDQHFLRTHNVTWKTWLFKEGISKTIVTNRRIKILFIWVKKKIIRKHN